MLCLQMIVYVGMISVCVDDLIIPIQIALELALLVRICPGDFGRLMIFFLAKDSHLFPAKDSRPQRSLGIGALSSFLGDGSETGRERP